MTPVVKAVFLFGASILLFGCVTVVNEQEAKGMDMLELCSSLCELSSLTDTPPTEDRVCPAPNRFVLQELIARFPASSLTAEELTNLSRLSVSEMQQFLSEGVSECAFLSLMKLPDGQGGNFHYSDGYFSYYFYEVDNKVLANTFSSSNGSSTRKSLTFTSVLEMPESNFGTLSNEPSKSREQDVYLDGVRIPRSQCIGAIVMGECKGTAVMPERPGRKKCYGSVVAGNCVGAEF